MLRNEKIAFGKGIVGKTSSLSSALICKCLGLTANELTKLRLSVRRAGGYIQMGSNRVISKALEETSFNYVGNHLKGPNFVIFFDDSKSIIDIIKIVNDEIKAHKGKIEFKCCNINGMEMSVDFFKKVASIKTEAQLIGTFMSSIMLSAQYFRTALSKPSRSLAISMEEYYKSKEGQQ